MNMVHKIEIFKISQTRVTFEVEWTGPRNEKMIAGMSKEIEGSDDLEITPNYIFYDNREIPEDVEDYYFSFGVIVAENKNRMNEIFIDAYKDFLIRLKEMRETDLELF